MTKCPYVIIVQGQPCTGKSRLVRTLTNRLGIPYIARDEFKEVLFDRLGTRDREWSQKLGGASYDLLFAAFEKLLQTRSNFLIESNFTPDLHSQKIAALLRSHGYSAIDLFLEADPDVLMERFIHRWTTGERHRGHVDNERIEDLRERLKDSPLQPLGLGPLIRLNTTEFGAIDVAGLIETLGTASLSRSKPLAHKVHFRTLDTSNNDELQVIARIHEEAPAFWEPGYEPDNARIIRCTEKLKKASGMSLLLIAESEESGIVGFHWVDIEDIGARRFGYVKSLWVKDDHQNQGIASKMKQQGEEWARKMGAQFMKTTVHVRNERMRAFNLKRGFKEGFIEMTRTFGDTRD